MGFAWPLILSRWVRPLTSAPPRIQCAFRNTALATNWNDILRPPYAVCTVNAIESTAPLSEFDRLRSHGLHAGGKLARRAAIDMATAPCKSLDLILADLAHREVGRL